MSINKYKPHVLLIPEDDANRQLANGFLLHHAVSLTAALVRAPAGGWRNVLSVFEREYVDYLRKYPLAHVVLLIDFDEADQRRTESERLIPDDVKPRVFLLGASDEPETVKQDLRQSFERIGEALAEECDKGVYTLWTNQHFGHNNAELQRLVTTVRPILFQGS